MGGTLLRRLAEHRHEVHIATRFPERERQGRGLAAYSIFSSTSAEAIRRAVGCHPCESDEGRDLPAEARRRRASAG